jgi:hypothetical protein
VENKAVIEAGPKVRPPSCVWMGEHCTVPARIGCCDRHEEQRSPVKEADLFVACSFGRDSRTDEAPTMEYRERSFVPMYLVQGGAPRSVQSALVGREV